MSVFGIIYSAFCTANGKYYVGQTIGTLNARKNEHHCAARTNSDECLAFHKAIRKYGRDSFAWSIVQEIFSGQDELNLAEIFWIKALNSLSPNGYNLREGGNSGGRLSEETKQKIAAKVRGNTFHLGHKHSDEVRKLISEKVRAANELNPRKPHTDEAKKKMSDAKRGRKFSLEHRLAIGAAAKGRKRSPESIAKSAAGNRHPRGPYKKRRVAS